MTDKAEHRAAMHSLATERRAAGLPAWDKRINLADVFHNQDLTFEQRRDAIVKRIYGSGWNSDEAYTLAADLADTQNAEEFDEVWNAVYDLADYDRVWIATL